MNRRLFLLALALLACSAGVGPALLAREPAAHTVVIEGMQFKPTTLNIHPGDSVTWVNKDIVEHTATTPASAKHPFDSGLIAVGKSWKRTFNEIGTYEYLCTYHPTMKGAIKVTAARPAATYTPDPRSPRRVWPGSPTVGLLLPRSTVPAHAGAHDQR